MADLTQLDAELEQLAAIGRRRGLRQVHGAQDRIVLLDGREVLNFCSNNYLGLASHPAVVMAAQRTLESDGFGASASRLIVGNHDVHAELERAMVDWLGCDSARLFNSGYHANLGVLQSLADREDVIFSDELNHASIIDGCRLSRATVVVYPHRDLVALETKLHNARHYRRRLIVTESLFSMDGDIAPLTELAQLANAFDAILVVDEAHAIGVLGPEGTGLSDSSTVKVVTLGKALGTFGAVVAGPRPLADYLLNRARTFIFTTALPPVIAAASIASLTLIRGVEGAHRRRALQARIEQFATGLVSLGITNHTPTSPIFPIIVGDERQTMTCCDYLLNAGLYAQGIRPPTVPRGTSRLRITLTSNHTPTDIASLLTALNDLQRLQLLPSSPSDHDPARTEGAT